MCSLGGLRRGAHQPCGALAQRLPHHRGLKGLEAHVVQGDPKGQELRLVRAQQVVVGLWGQRVGNTGQPQARWESELGRCSSARFTEGKTEQKGRSASLRSDRAWLDTVPTFLV